MIDLLISFFAHFGLALALLVAYVALYVRLTPYHEFRLIREGNLAATLALLGALAGFTLPVASAVAHSAGLVDMALWALLAIAVQSTLYLLIARLLPEIPDGISRGVTAHGALLGGTSLCLGLLNAACITY